jgi:hypothetical protein
MEREPDNAALIPRAYKFRGVLDLAGIDPDSKDARMLRTLAQNDERELLELFTPPLMRRAAQRVMERRLFRALTQATSGSLVIGDSTDGVEIGAEVRLDIRTLARHLAILGSSGSGKSWLLRGVVRQLIRQQVPVWLFDLHGEFSDLLREFARDRLWFVKPPWMKLGLFQPPDGTEPRAWIGHISSLLRAVYMLGDGSVTILSGVLNELFLRRGCFRGSNNWPTLAHVKLMLDQMKFAQTSRSAGYRETLARCVRILLDRMPETFNVVRSMPIQEFTRRSVIWDVSELQPQDLELYLCTLLRAAGQQDDLLVVVVEEAHTLLSRNRSQFLAFGEPPFQAEFRAARKRQIGLVIVDQVPSQLPQSVLANVETTIAFPLKNAACVYTTAMAIGLDREKQALLPVLKKRHAIVSNTDLGAPLLVRVPEIERAVPPDADEIEREMTPILARLPFVPVEGEHAAVPVGAPMSSGPAARREGEERGVAREPARAAERERARPFGLSLEALKYLEAANEPRFHLLPLSQFDAALQIPAARGNQLRGELALTGLIDITPIRSGARGAPIKIITISGKGYETLREMNVMPKPPKGKGGQARFWAYTICRWLVRTQPGAKPQIEMRVGDKAIDVACEHDGVLTGYEIQMSPGWSSENVAKDLMEGTGADEVVICAVTEEELREIKERLERELGPDGGWARVQHRVAFRLLRTFLA